MIQVVAGLIVREGEALLTQRPRGKKCSGLWETPGGKQEGDESFHDALRRELREELGVEVGALPEVAFASAEFLEGSARFELPPFSLLCYLVRDFAGEPRPLEGQGIGWFGAASILALPLAPANDQLRAKLIRTLRLCK